MAVQSKKSGRDHSLLKIVGENSSPVEIGSNMKEKDTNIFNSFYVFKVVSAADTFANQHYLLMSDPCVPLYSLACSSFFFQVQYKKEYEKSKDQCDYNTLPATENPLLRQLRYAGTILSDVRPLPLLLFCFLILSNFN